MHKTPIILIVVLTFLTFFNCLFNDFVGDDNFLIVNNSFYESWERLPLIFTKSLIMDPNDVFNNSTMYTGINAFRPLVAITYFFDYWLWERNPFGYHLQNVLWHILNAVLVYFVVFFCLRKNSAALLSAIIFSVHPMKTEPVCAISYRADLLVTFLVLSGLICYIKYRENESATKRIKFLGAHILFFLALLTKEPGLVFLPLIMAYDKLIKEESWSVWGRQALSRYTGFICILFLYLYLYIKIFPNNLLIQGGFLGGSLKTHLLTMLTIFSKYIAGFILPFHVKILPPFYVPSVNMEWNIENLTAAMIVLIFFTCFFQFFRKDRKLFFFLFLFLAGFIPVSNLLTLSNPMAYRFMYLPSIGIITAFVLVLDRIFTKQIFVRNKQLASILKLSIISTCVIFTVLYNAAWKNEKILAFNFYKDFPDSPVSHLWMGIVHFDWGKQEESQGFLKKSVEMGVTDPRAYYLLGVITKNDIEQSKFYFEQCANQFPRTGYCYAGLGRSYFLSRDYENATPVLTKSLELAPRYSTYGYLIQVYLLRGDTQKAQDLLSEARKELNERDSLSSLSNFFIDDKKRFPIDIGI